MLEVFKGIGQAIGSNDKDAAPAPRRPKIGLALGGGLAWVWVAFSAVFMGARFVVLTLRARGEHWLVTGVSA